MASGSGLPGAVVHRSLADWPVVLAAWLLLVSATTLLATGVVYGDAVASSGLQRAILAAPATSRAVDVSLSSQPDGIDGYDAVIRPALRAALGATGGEVIRVVKSGTFADPATPAGDVHDLTSFESLDGIESHATLVAGAWPHAGADPLETTLSEAAATALGLQVGDHLSLVSRQDASVHVSIVVTGIWRTDVADAAWFGDPLETNGATTEGSFTTRGPIVVREADLVSLGGGNVRVAVSWRGVPAISALRIDGLAELRAGMDGLNARLQQQLPAATSQRVTTGMPALLDEVGRSVLVSRSGVILLTIQFAVLAGYAIVLVAGMLVERRRPEIALMRSRGASATHLISMALMEAVLLAVPAALIAPWLALGLVVLLGAIGPAASLGIAGSAAIGISAFVVSALAGLACIVALTLPTLFVSASPAGARAAAGRQSRTTLPQRLGLDLALLAVAAVALWQLRLYGAPLTRTARGTLGLDPLLVAAPAIGLVAGAVVALRVVPRVAELGERLLVRGRGLVGSLGGRQLARRPLRYTRAALLLMLASALGTLAAAHAATWSRSQADQATYQAAADVRVLAADYSDLPTWGAGPLYRSIPGVRTAVPVTVSPFNLGRTIRDGHLVALDPAAAGGVLRPEAAPPGSPSTTSLLATLAAARPTVATTELPADIQRLAFDVDAAFRVDPQFTGESEGPPGPEVGTLSVSAVLEDADGRLFRTAVVAGSLAMNGQRLVIPIVDVEPDVSPSLRPSGPLRLDAIELGIDLTGGLPIVGSAEITSVTASSEAAGDAGWVPVAVDPTAPGWQWRRLDAQDNVTFTPSPDRPMRVAVAANRPIFGASTFRVGAGLPEDIALPAIASTAFLAAAGVAVGETLNIETLGVPLQVKIIDATETFAPLDPSVPFLLTDLASADALQLAATGEPRRADEWWLSVDAGQAPAVIDHLRQPAFGAATVIGHDELMAQLTTDPVPLGLIGVLGLGSLAAMLFAGIGFLVSSTVSTTERLGEFALLRALGLSAGQLSLWLSIESVFLLVVGLAAGSVLGLILAWLVLPFATLTQTGVAPVPTPVVVVPWEAIVPVYLAAIVLFVVSIWLVRRQLPDVRISGVLRAGQG